MKELKVKTMVVLVFALMVFSAGKAQTSKIPKGRNMESVANLTGPDSAYMAVVIPRSEKIVEKMEISAQQKEKLKLELAFQYWYLNRIYTHRDAQVQVVKKSSAGKAEIEKRVQQLQEEAKKSTDSLHPIFIKRVQKLVGKNGLEMVKNGMTYNVLPITWAGYQDMLPQLTDAQKRQIYAWLEEARENAMDAESSEKKHGWFGKYKGRINNYLSAEGYDMKKESKAWEERVRARQK